MVTISPPCTACSLLQNLSGGPDPAEFRKAAQLFEFAVELCLLVDSVGGIFVLEHPETSRAWDLACTKKLLHSSRLFRAKFHMCAHGMTSQDSQGQGLVLKPTVMMTNAVSVAEQVERRCEGNHRHVTLLDGRAKKAEEYPVLLSDRLLKGLIIETRARQELLGLNSVDYEDMCDPEDVDNVAPENVWYSETMLDAKGNQLDLKRVRVARGDELGTMGKMQVYDYVRWCDAKATPGAIFIDTTWVDAIKDGNYKSRLCGREFAAGSSREDLFAGTPPLLATKAVISD